MFNQNLQLQQLSSKLEPLASLQRVATPPTGWIKAIRSALGMSLQQLGSKLSISKQSLHEIETREKDGSITLKLLNDAANALDMQLVYAVVPKDGTFEALIERKARELATKIVLRTSNTMKLEDQEVTKQRLEQAIQERTIMLKNEMPKALWD